MMANLLGLMNGFFPQRNLMACGRGTGKTSLYKAMAQKLSIRLSSRYPQCQLIEVNARSLFSKLFSESGKMLPALGLCHSLYLR